MDIQLQVTDKELEEFPEERSDEIGTPITNRADISPPTPKVKQRKITKQHQIDTQPATRPVVTYTRRSLDYSSRVPLLLSIHIQPDLQALTQTLTPKALRYLHVGIHIGKCLSNK